ncbi:hypothetical protein CCZ01_02755 [Helicobacter monodelphidis]|uniref:SoxW family protein n=1 Tax=Helicobacter sp. 15-1451 TaxID=2004995 RepID=UPI000DCC140B|nr:thioredoxin family protein [Helicobacter sp. 15-1451]RAX58354.1 hypothetical protein CCZ01_02755 [Helicobacter sp. 15-1451]
MYWKSFIVCLLLILSGCGNEQEHDKIVSLGTQTSQEVLDKINNLDKASYAELEGIVKDNARIDPEGKYLMIIFGANGCTYCDMLKKEIKSSQAIQDKLKADFSPYYVNSSYLKTHYFVNGLQPAELTTNDLVMLYRIGPTPTTIFATPEGKTILIRAGAITGDKFLATLEFITDKKWEGAQSDKEINQRYLEFLQGVEQ